MRFPYTKGFHQLYSFLLACFVSFIIVFIGLSQSYAQSVSENTKEISVKKMLDGQGNDEVDQQIEKYDGPEDEFERGYPRNAIAGYLQAMRAGDLSLATQYLDYRNLSEKTLSVGKEELARQLSVVLNRTLWVDLHSISATPQGKIDDGLPSYRERVGTIKYRGRDVDILLQRVPRAKDKVKIWKISNATV
jgi:MscS family membrane protein